MPDEPVVTDADREAAEFIRDTFIGDAVFANTCAEIISRKMRQEREDRAREQAEHAALKDKAERMKRALEKMLANYGIINRCNLCDDKGKQDCEGRLTKSDCSILREAQEALEGNDDA